MLRLCRNAAPHLSHLRHRSGFLANRELIFCTDRRSRKVAEIRSRSDAELCWYFGAPREQFRLSGSLTLVDSAVKSPREAEARRQVGGCASGRACSMGGHRCAALRRVCRLDTWPASTHWRNPNV